VLPAAQKKGTFEGDWSAASGEQGLRQLMEQYPEMDAVFACNDQMALGALQAAHQLNLRVPQNLGLVGFDNIPESAYFWPALTTVRHQLIEQGKIIVRELISMIEAMQQAKRTVQPDANVLQPHLVIRNSSVVS
jgi:LacI family transcriptional regulator